MVHNQWGEATWGFNESVEIGPRMMARLGKRFHFNPEDL